MEETLKDYLYTVRSKETQKIYIKYFEYFYNFGKKSASELLSMDIKDIQSLLVKYIIHMRDRKLATSSIKSRISPIITCLELNDILVNKKKISRYYGEEKKTNKDFAYTNEDIAKMLTKSKLRTKVMILLYSSTGIRKSAILDLKLKHITKIPEFNLYKFTIYENAKEEYTTMCTPECASMIDQYIEHRKEAGESITPESYLIRNDFDWVKSTAKNPKPLDQMSLTTLFRKMLITTGLRKDGEPLHKRHSKALFQGFRKFFNTTLANANVNVLIKELLLGHDINLDSSYYRPSQQTMLVEYAKAINDLSIDDAYKWKDKVKKLEIDNSILKQHELQMAAMSQKIQVDESKIEKLLKLEKFMKQVEGFAFLHDKDRKGISMNFQTKSTDAEEVSKETENAFEVLDNVFNIYKKEKRQGKEQN